MTKILVNPGQCGFQSVVEAQRTEANTVSITIHSACEQVIQLNNSLPALTLRDVFLPPERNVVFHWAGKVCCHASCPLPLAILKSAEVEFGMAVPQDVSIAFALSGTE